jgi:hypothetical protein
MRVVQYNQICNVSFFSLALNFTFCPFRGIEKVMVKLIQAADGDVAQYVCSALSDEVPADRWHQMACPFDTNWRLFDIRITGMLSARSQGKLHSKLYII